MKLLEQLIKQVTCDFLLVFNPSTFDIDSQTLISIW